MNIYLFLKTLILVDFSAQIVLIFLNKNIFTNNIAHYIYPYQFGIVTFSLQKPNKIMSFRGANFRDSTLRSE